MEAIYSKQILERNDKGSSALQVLITQPLSDFSGKYEVHEIITCGYCYLCFVFGEMNIKAPGLFYYKHYVYLITKWLMTMIKHNCCNCDSAPTGAFLSYVLKALK